MTEANYNAKKKKSIFGESPSVKSKRMRRIECSAREHSIMGAGRMPLWMQAGGEGMSDSA